MQPRMMILMFVVLALVTRNAVGQAPATPITEGYSTTSGGLRIHYLKAGSATAVPALVLIPGWRLPAYLWDEQLRHFSEMTKVFAIDPRSQGPSAKTADGNTPESRARDLHDLLSKLGVQRCVLVGWSQGAQDVAAYVEQFGADRVAGVVFVDSPVSFGPAEVEAHKEFAQTILGNLSVYARDPGEFSEGFVRSIFKRPHPELDMDKLAKFTLQTPTDTGVAMLVADIFGADRRKAFSKLNKPVLVIASAASPLLGVQQEMAKAIPGAKFVAIEGAGHAVFVDDPEQFDRELTAFIRSLPE